MRYRNEKRSACHDICHTVFIKTLKIWALYRGKRRSQFIYTNCLLLFLFLRDVTHYRIARELTLNQPQNNRIYAGKYWSDSVQYIYPSIITILCINIYWSERMLYQSFSWMYRDWFINTNSFCMWRITLVSCVRSVFLFPIKYLPVILVKVLLCHSKDDGAILHYSMFSIYSLGCFILSKWLCSVKSNKLFICINKVWKRILICIHRQAGWSGYGFGGVFWRNSKLDISSLCNP